MNVAAPARFSLRIPETWIEFDVWRATRTGDLVRLVDERLREFPDLRPHRAAILRGVRELAAEAEKAGAVYCASAADRVDEDGVLLASLMVFSTEGLPEPALNTVPAIAAQLPTVPRSDGSPEWREVTVVDLTAGPAVQVRGVALISPADGVEPVPLVTMQTLVPAPDGRGVLNVVLTSPQVSVADPMLDLFDAVSASLTWEEGPPAR